MTGINAQGTVAIVVDCCFGERLVELVSSGTPVWVLDTADNRLFLEDHDPSGQPPPGPGRVTTFTASFKESPEEAFIRILPAVDLHHNELAGDPPYSAVEVFGVGATEAVREALGNFDLTVVEEAVSHFRAEVRPQGLPSDPKGGR
jgi:hypothetical protein